MPSDLPTLTVTPKWDGDRLMLGSITVGEIGRRWDGLWKWSITNQASIMTPTESAGHMAEIVGRLR